MQSFRFLWTIKTKIFYLVEIAKLIGRCRQGDSDAFNELYTTYKNPMRSVCRRYISDEQAINDVIHDSFVIILTSLHRLRDDSKAVGWMLSITRNVASKYKDYQKKHPTVSLERIDAKEVLAEVPQEKDAKNISMAEMMSLIDKLPEGYGQVFRLSVFEGLSHKEIAEKLGIEPHSSSSQLARAKSMLRKMIRQYWAVFLLFLIPISFFLLKKENSIEINNVQIVENQKKTQSILPTEQTQSPMIVSQPENASIFITDSLQSAVDIANESSVSDTIMMIAQNSNEISIDSLLNNQRCDTIQFIQKTELPYYNFADIFSEKSVSNSKNAQRWSIEFAYAGSFDEQNFDNLSIKEGSKFSGNNILPHSDQDTVLYIKTHYMPLTVTLAVHYKQSERFGFESGLSYIRLNSEFKNEINGNLSKDTLQIVHYLGIPVKCIYNMCTVKGWSLYGNLGFTMGIPIHSRLNTKIFTPEISETNTSVQVPWLWSVSAGIGLQYNVTRNIGIFAEPGVLYYIPKNNNVETYCTEHPFSFALPLGIKINL